MFDGTISYNFNHLPCPKPSFENGVKCRAQGVRDTQSWVSLGAGEKSPKTESYVEIEGVQTQIVLPICSIDGYINRYMISYDDI